MDLHRVREHTYVLFLRVLLRNTLITDHISISPSKRVFHSSLSSTISVARGSTGSRLGLHDCSFPASTSTTNMSLRQALSVPPFSVCTLACWWERDRSRMHGHQSPGKPLPSQQYSTSPRGYRRSTRTSLSKWDSGKFLCGAQRVNPVRISKASSPCFDAFLVPASY